MKRTLLIFVATLWVWVGSGVALLASLEQQDYYLRGYVSPLSDEPLPFRVPLFGVNADLTRYGSEEELHQQFETMTAVGVVWVRQIVDWSAIQSTPTTYDWSTWDRVFAVLPSYPQLQLIPVIVNAPDWAHSTPCSANCSDYWFVPDNPEDYSNFVQVFAERYGNYVRYYQVWDEPNIRIAWGDGNPSATQYAALLSSAYNAIHKADADAQVIAAALAPNVETGPQNLSDLLYLRELYALGIEGYSDAIAAKPYGFSLSPDDRAIDDNTLNFSRLVALREIMLENGDGDKHLWASNFGWNSLPEEWQGQPSIWETVTAQEQIDFTLKALYRAEVEWPWTGGMILQTWQPDDPVDDPIWGFALLDPDNRRTSLLNELSSHQAHRGNSATNGLYPAMTPFAEYIGTWSLSDFGADLGWVNDSQVHFMFQGSAVGLITRQGDYVTNLYVTVDGEPANLLPHDPDGNAFLLLRSDTLQPRSELVPIASNLDNHDHLLTLKAIELIPDESQNRWPIIGYAVQGDDLATPYRNQVRASTLTFTIMSVALLIAGAQIHWRMPQLTRRLHDLMQLLISLMTSAALMVSLLLTWQDGAPTWFRREPLQLGLSLITSGLIYWNALTTPMTIVLVGVLFLLIHTNLKIGLSLIVFWAPFFLFPVELYLYAFPMVEVLLIITFAAWFLRGMAAWGEARRAKEIFWTFNNWKLPDTTILAWVMIGLLALTWSSRTEIALTDFRTLIFEPALFYLMLRTVRFSQTDTRSLLMMLVLSASLVSVIGLFQLGTGTFIEAEGGARRLASVYGSPNNAALFLGRILPIAIVFVLTHIGKQRRLALLATTTILVALLLTLSAGSLFLGLPVATALMVLLFFGRKALVPLLGIIAIAGIALFIASQFPRFERLTDVSTGTNFYRLRVWESAINMIEDRPLTGIGLDQFLYEFRGTYIMPDAWEEPELSHPHNILLDFWLRFGLLGLAWLVLSQVTFWKSVQRVWGDQPELRVYWIGLCGSMAYLLAHGLVDNSVFVLDLIYVFMLVYAMPTILVGDQNKLSV